MKKTLCILFAAFVLGSILVQVFDRFLDTECIFWKEAVDRSDDWASRLDAQFPTKYVVAGGSSSRTSLDPQIILDEFGVPLVTAALPAGFGPSVHVAGALPYLRPGDTLILALEPTMLAISKSQRDSHGTTGDKFLAYHLPPSVYAPPFLQWEAPDVARLLRGHTYQILVRTIRHFIGETPYRYTEKELHPSGWLEVSSKKSLPLPPCYVAKSWIRWQPSPWSLEFLQLIADWGKKNKIRVVYALPRTYWAEDSRIYHALVALKIVNIMPVLKDRALGTDTNPDHFSDTTAHASREGTQVLSREWGRALSEGDFWTRRELLDYIHSHGWNEDGTPRNVQKTADTP